MRRRRREQELAPIAKRAVVAGVGTAAGDKAEGAAEAADSDHEAERPNAGRAHAVLRRRRFDPAQPPPCRSSLHVHGGIPARECCDDAMLTLRSLADSVETRSKARWKTVDRALTARPTREPRCGRAPDADDQRGRLARGEPSECTKIR